MLRQLYIVAATQVVTSESNPQGVYGNVANYPKQFDSRNYEATEQNPNGNPELALIVAQADYADVVKQLSLAHNRAMWAVTLTRADGVLVERKSYGAFPDMTPPEPEEPEAETETE
jgi:hypothetical protein